ncbi:hypothetical protein QN219_19740 [Sinorhizobium sp. 7-81]|nr:hypothetical protein [Sinorhizobium sp. 8-89]MDK1492274.1 hypothetical protein [Sinorhizobium sp. 8-89]
MDELPPHRCRARQPLEPRAQRYRHYPLRYPQHCGSFLPLIGTNIQTSKTAPTACFLKSLPI